MNLNPGEVHIWSAIINESYHKILANAYLSEKEKKKGESFEYDIDAYLYLVKHNLLRIILGRYLKCDPTDICFKNNTYGKPSIAYPHTSIQFNISTSSNRFVAAFCLHHKIGVDIELIRHIENINQLTTNYYTINEAAWIYSHPESMLEKLFFSIWTQKEAIVKAIGKGLSLEFNTFDILSASPIFFEDDQWNIISLAIFDDCATAIAINSPTVNISYYNADQLL
jgi:4'-phosphopantetheinyl transferase